MSNPYQTPQYAGGVSPLAADVDREKLRRVAKYQQWVIYAVLANLLVYLGAVALQIAGFEAIGQLMILLLLPIALFAMVAIALLANELYNVAVAVVCALLMLVPCISLITLLVVNGGATKYLQQRGVKVGFMGANPNLI